MRLLHLMFTLALLVLLGAANPMPEPEPHKIHHHRPPQEQRACLDTCWVAGRTKVLQPKLDCAACMDRIRDTVCFECAKSMRDLNNYQLRNFHCWKCYRYVPGTYGLPGETMG